MGNAADFTEIFSGLLADIGETGLCHVPILFLEKTFSEFDNRAGGRITVERFRNVATWAFRQDRYRQSVFLDAKPHWEFVNNWNRIASDYEKAENRPKKFDPTAGPEALTEIEKRSVRRFYEEQGKPGTAYASKAFSPPSARLAAEIDWEGSPEELRTMTRPTPTTENAG